MRYKMKYGRSAILAIAVLVLCIFSTNQLFAQGKKLPEGKKIYEDYLKAIDSKKFLNKAKNSVVTLDMTIPDAGFEAKMTRYAAAPNKYYAKVDILGYGTVERGCDGNVVWEIHPKIGPRIIKGQERDMMLHFAHFNIRDYQKQFKSIQCIGEEKVGDEECYRVRFTPQKTKPYTSCFSKKSGLELKSTKSMVSDQLGGYSVVNLLTKYQAVDGVKYAHGLVEKAKGVDTIMTITSIKHNVELPKNRFDLPQAVKDLIGQEQAGK